jgi:hypothetical protein
MKINVSFLAASSPARARGSRFPIGRRRLDITCSCIRGRKWSAISFTNSHPLVASCVGLLTIALAVTLWFGERRTWLRWLGVTALLVVIAQGILGGLRVVLLQNTLAILHACLAQAFFALTVGLALFSSREWAGEPPQAPITDSGRLCRRGAITTALIYLQVIFAPCYGTPAKDWTLICSLPG